MGTSDNQDDPNHTRHVREFRPVAVATPATSGNYQLGSADTTSNATTYTWPEINHWAPNVEEEKRLTKLKANREWERRLWKARSNGRNVPTYPSRS